MTCGSRSPRSIFTWIWVPGVPNVDDVVKNNMAASKSPILPTHYRPVSVQRSGLRVREKYVLLVICVIFCCLMFGAFFFVPDFPSGSGYLAAYAKFVVRQTDRQAVPIKPPVKDTASVNPKGEMHSFVKLCYVSKLCLVFFI